MSRLNPLEQEALDVVVVILDLMGAGHRKMSGIEHMDLMEKLRRCKRHLINKSYGCQSGEHSGHCSCKEKKFV